MTTQHALSTQTIEMSKDEKSAEAMTYFSGIHFGKGRWEGQEVTVYGKYIDTLIKDTTKGNLLFPSTRWLISKRELVVMGRTGEVRVMEGE